LRAGNQVSLSEGEIKITMKRVAVTGGAGFIGTNLTNRLIGLDHDVKIIDDLSSGLKTNISKNCEFEHLCITNLEKLKHSLKDCTVIFHLAARGSVPRSIKNPLKSHKINTLGTLNILEVARETGAQVIFSSSSSVYGSNNDLPKHEKMWLQPITPYAASKLSAESFLQAYSATYGVKVSILRLFNVFGPFQRPDHIYSAVIPKWIWLAINNKPIEVYGDGHTSRDFTFVKDVVEILMSSINNSSTFDSPVNVAFGSRIKLIDIVEVLQKSFPQLQVNFMPFRMGDIKDSQNSPKLVKSIFSTIVPTAFSEALNSTIDWMKEYGPQIANGPAIAD
jgi:UDP-glucose 4-epimerase